MQPLRTMFQNDNKINPLHSLFLLVLCRSKPLYLQNVFRQASRRAQDTSVLSPSTCQTAQRAEKRRVGMEFPRLIIECSSVLSHMERICHASALLEICRKEKQSNTGLFIRTILERPDLVSYVRIHSSNYPCLGPLKPNLLEPHRERVEKLVATACTCPTQIEP